MGFPAAEGSPGRRERLEGVIGGWGCKCHFLFQDKEKVSLPKTPKLDRSDGKDVRERATKRKLPFTVGAHGEQKDSDTGTARGRAPGQTPQSCSRPGGAGVSPFLMLG